MTRAKVCLWFDQTAEDAAQFYKNTFPDDCSIDSVSRKGDGTALTVEFTVFGIPCLGLNGGPHYKLSEAFSFQIITNSQEETDNYWNALVADGGEEGRCAWCKDKFGVSWQVVPKALTEALSDKDPAAAKRSMAAMMTMKKIDIAAIEAARKGSA